MTFVDRSRVAMDRLFAWKVRGIRWIEIIGVALVAVLVFSVYIAKAGAAREGAEIARLERDIAENSQRVRLLRAEAARLENPARLEALSRQAGLAPVAIGKRADEDALATLKPGAEEALAADAAPPTVALATTPIAPEADPAALEEAR